MPYRVEAGSTVLMLDINHQNSTEVFKVPVDFELKEMIASPLSEHHDKEGLTESPYDTYPWGFDVKGKWTTGKHANTIVKLYAKEVHVIKRKGEEGKFVKVSGSGKNVYTLKIENGQPVSCSCPGWRFKNPGWCKHMSNYQ